MEAYMNLYIEGEPAHPLKAISAVVGAATAVIGADVVGKVFWSSGWIFTWWAFALWCVVSAIVWCWYANVSPMHKYIETTLNEAEVVETLKFRESVNLTSKQLQSIYSAISEEQAVAPVMNGEAHDANPLI